MELRDKNKTNHLALHVDHLTLTDWDKVRRLESPDPDQVIKWSRWLREKVDIALKTDVLQSVAVDTSSVEVQELKRANGDLKKRLAALESREIGVSFNRVIEILQGVGGYVDFDVIVQKLIDTEMTATYKALEELAGKYIVEVDPRTGNKWRLRS